MAAIQQPPNIWAQMSYTPPRGPCSQKTSMVSTCACFRFMIHPLKAASSFDCDGCGHHASFHRMENKEDEEVARRWRIEEGVRGGATGVTELLEGLRGGPKRRRIEAKGKEDEFGGLLEVVDVDEEESEERIGGRPVKRVARKGRGNARQ